MALTTKLSDSRARNRIDWIHWTLLIAIGILAWNCYQKELEISSAHHLIVVQSKALETSHRALESTVEWQSYKNVERDVNYGH